MRGRGDQGRERDFLRVWFGQSVSGIGSQVTLLALPFVAVDTLRSGPFAVGALTAASTAPFLLGLPAGALVDRWRCRRVMIAADVGRAVVLATVPAAWWVGALSLAQLFVVALVAGGLTVFFDVAYQSWVPTLVEPDRLVAANSRLAASASAAEMGGPAVGGVLIGSLGAAVAVAVDAGSFVVSVLSLAGLRHRDGTPPARSERRPLRRDVAEGVRFVWSEHRVRALMVAGGTLNLFEAVVQAVLLLWLRRHFGLSADRIGVLLALGCCGGLAGATAAPALARRFGVGPVLIACAALAAAGNAGFPLATRHDVDVLVVAGQALSTFGGMGCNVTQVSLRQVLCPPELAGRMHASFRTVAFGALPLGGLAGGAIAEAFGLRTALWVAVAGGALATPWLAASPVRRLRDMPTEPVIDLVALEQGILAG